LLIKKPKKPKVRGPSLAIFPESLDPIGQCFSTWVPRVSDKYPKVRLIKAPTPRKRAIF
jgi:hypothetical protein